MLAHMHGKANCDVMSCTESIKLIDLVTLE